MPGQDVGRPALVQSLFLNFVMSSFRRATTFAIKPFILYSVAHFTFFSLSFYSLVYNRERLSNHRYLNLLARLLIVLGILSCLTSGDEGVMYGRPLYRTSHVLGLIPCHISVSNEQKGKVM